LPISIFRPFFSILSNFPQVFAALTVKQKTKKVKRVWNCAKKCDANGFLDTYVGRHLGWSPPVNGSSDLQLCAFKKKMRRFSLNKQRSL
jgi:hypothetical protein